MQPTRPHMQEVNLCSEVNHAAELKKVKGCLPHKFAGDNTLRNATNVAFEILGENTGGILILDLKTFEISFQC